MPKDSQDRDDRNKSKNSKNGKKKNNNKKKEENEFDMRKEKTNNYFQPNSKLINILLPVI